MQEPAGGRKWRRGDSRACWGTSIAQALHVISIKPILRTTCFKAVLHTEKAHFGAEDSA